MRQLLAVDDIWGPSQQTPTSKQFTELTLHPAALQSRLHTGERTEPPATAQTDDSPLCLLTWSMAQGMRHWMSVLSWKI